MIVYRLTKDKDRNELSGFGAEINGGRWNNKGKSIIYTSKSRALCTTEIAVHTPLGLVPKNYFLQTVELPEINFLEISVKNLDEKWRSFPHHNSTKVIGDKFIEDSKYLILKVPSAIVQDEFNYLINPRHKHFNKVILNNIEEFNFDYRLFKK